jgi:hypothetical protein
MAMTTALDKLQDDVTDLIIQYHREHPNSCTVDAIRNLLEGLIEAIDKNEIEELRNGK